MTSLYIHIPFCKSKCLFCSFVICVAKEHRIDSYLENLEKEARSYKGIFVSTVYVGGGTPTLLNGSQLKKLFTVIRENFKFDPASEFTVEANPETIDSDKAKLLRDSGVNRVSLGVQSLNDKYLKFLGRNHDSAGAVRAFEILRKAGFSNINLDLMFSFPGQTPEELTEDVRGITALNSEHLSLYALSPEEGSKFYKQDIRLKDDSAQAQHYVRVVELLGQAGFFQYEISNFAKPGKESQHNCAYWQAENYIGLGIGAHSHKDGERFWNTSNLHEYISNGRENFKPMAGKEILPPAERLVEALLFGLRMTQGVNLTGLQERFGFPLPQEKLGIINSFIGGGFLSQGEDRLKTTLKGRLVLDELSARLI